MIKKDGFLLKNEDGFAAIVIAMVLIIVLSLLTVGFAELMRKEVKSATDKHLSSQAYYAAESGVNDAAKAINAGYKVAKPTCDYQFTTQPGNNYLSHPNVGSDSNVGYSCLLIDPAPKSLEYGPSDATQSKIVELSGVSVADPTLPQIIDHINIGWQDPDGSAVFNNSNSHSLSSTATWPSKTGIVRIALIPLASAGITRGFFASNTFAAFLYPSTSNTASTTTYPSYQFSTGIGDKQGIFMDGNCNIGSKPRFCNATVAGLGSANYLLAMNWLYKPSRMTITAYDYNNNILRIANAQTMVDSTGKAQGVLRRVQARIPNKNNFNHSDYGLEVMDGICKQYSILPDSANNACSP